VIPPLVGAGHVGSPGDVVVIERDQHTPIGPHRTIAVDHVELADVDQAAGMTEFVKGRAIRNLRTGDCGPVSELGLPCHVGSGIWPAIDGWGGSRCSENAASLEQPDDDDDDGQHE